VAPLSQATLSFNTLLGERRISSSLVLLNEMSVP